VRQHLLRPRRAQVRHDGLQLLERHTMGGLEALERSLGLRAKDARPRVHLRLRHVPQLHQRRLELLHLLALAIASTVEL
jgi:hypothetical protein